MTQDDHPSFSGLRYYTTTLSPFPYRHKPNDAHDPLYAYTRTLQIHRSAPTCRHLPTTNFQLPRKTRHSPKRWTVQLFRYPGNGKARVTVRKTTYAYSDVSFKGRSTGEENESPANSPGARCTYLNQIVCIDIPLLYILQ
jgi:hypothetical protein